MEEVIETMDNPRHEDPYFYWTVQCYHYDTVHYTVQQSDGKGGTTTVHKTRQEKVVTHSATHSGRIPSTDLTPEFIPLTGTKMTQIDTKLALDYSESNYHDQYQQWKQLNYRDIHQNASHHVGLNSMCTSCLATWVEHGIPCWMRWGCYWLSNLLLVSVIYRWCIQARMGSQTYVYSKRCGDI